MPYFNNFQNWDRMPVGFIWLMLLIAVWDLVWKGMALWRAAKRNESGWFVALFLLNTAGILPLLYLYVFGGNQDKK